MRLQSYERMGRTEMISGLRKDLEDSPFGYWFGHESSDGALFGAKKLFLKNLNLNGWPFE